MRSAPATPPLTGPAAEREMRRLSRRSFVTGAIGAVAGIGVWSWLANAGREGDLAWPLRRVLRMNEGVAESLFPSATLAPPYPAEMVQGPARTNGAVGLAQEVDTEQWILRIEHAGRNADRTLDRKALQGLPRTDLVTELKCVEGWSEVMHFRGVRFVDFLTHFGLGTRSGRMPDPFGSPRDLYRYVYLATPGEEYYVGLDIASALHPQTLLCDAMNGQALTRAHGAPLRLYLAVKYGFKSLKRIGLIRFQDERPRDYWAERGYDWYAGL